MNIFIAGCGRSGTTLIRDLMRCFEDTYVYVEEDYGEAPFSSFSKIVCHESNIVIKRTGECWRTLSNLPNNIKLIYCVRHPFDVMTSIHPLTKHLRKFHITVDRWASEYESFHALQFAQPNRNIFILRYEDLVNTPNRLQEDIADYLDLKIGHKFSENPNAIDITKASVEKWKKDTELLRYLKSLPRRFRRMAGQFCNEFSYSLLEGYADGEAEVDSELQLISINNPNGQESLDGKPFFWMGGKSTLLTIYSDSVRYILLIFTAVSGPSFVEYNDRKLRATLGEWSFDFILQPGYVELEIPIQKGENEIILEALEKQLIPFMPNGDLRPLILGVGDLQIKKLD